MHLVHQCVTTRGNSIEDNCQGKFLTEIAFKCLQTSVSNNRCSPLMVIPVRFVYNMRVMNLVTCDIIDVELLPFGVYDVLNI